MYDKLGDLLTCQKYVGQFVCQSESGFYYTTMWIQAVYKEWGEICYSFCVNENMRTTLIEKIETCRKGNRGI